VDFAKDWRSDSLAGQNLLVGELCGVLGRLHSMEGLAQLNNNAKLNKGAKHDQTLLETSAKVEESKGKRAMSKDKYGYVSVDLWVFGYKNELFVFANDVEQVFYVRDLAKNN
jgi:hypothetical protein